MVRKVKEIIQNKLNNICYKKYAEEVERQKDCYRQWYLQNEGWKKRRYGGADQGIVIFADEDGILEAQAGGVTAAFFREHPYAQLAYGDEDRLDKEGRRCDPWFKPQWSPDTLDSFACFGHFFAVRRELLARLGRLDREALPPCIRDQKPEDLPEIVIYPAGERVMIYRMLLALTEQITAERWIAANEEKKAILPMGKVLLHMRSACRDAERTDLDESELPKAEAAAEAATISVIIPSKDNPRVLCTCLSGLREKTILSGAMEKPEILVVDNGSNEENKAVLEAMAEEFDFRYLYRPMEFNFSRMCNLGVEHSAGEYLLFLNDDMEILQPDWLAKLLEKASLPHAGAVGAKLLYPGGDLIQHIGITNIKVGPVHKLLKQHDGEVHYHGQNRHVYDMIGVTAACLLVARSKYLEAGGLYEEMAVAYNDVELNFSLYELGYYNIFRGDVTLYHHESLSRGDDNLSDEKWLRLLKEKDILYAKHPSLKSFDPFYSGNLAAHSNLYLPAFQYDYEKRDYYTPVRRWKKEDPARWENGCLIVNVEHAREEKKLEFTERDDVYWIEGWSYVLGMDNCRYQRSLILYGEKGSVYQAAVLNRYRRDVAKILPQQTHVELSGFTCRIPRDAVPADTYTIAMLAKDGCSKQRLFQRTDKKVTIRERL